MSQPQYFAGLSLSCTLHGVVSLLPGCRRNLYLKHKHAVGGEVGNLSGLMSCQLREALPPVVCWDAPLKKLHKRPLLILRSVLKPLSSYPMNWSVAKVINQPWKMVLGSCEKQIPCSSISGESGAVSVYNASYICTPLPLVSCGEEPQSFLTVSLLQLSQQCARVCV